MKIIYEASVEAKVRSKRGKHHLATSGGGEVRDLDVNLGEKSGYAPPHTCYSPRQPEISHTEWAPIEW